MAWPGVAWRGMHARLSPFKQLFRILRLLIRLISRSQLWLKAHIHDDVEGLPIRILIRQEGIVEMYGHLLIDDLMRRSC